MGHDPADPERRRPRRADHDPAARWIKSKAPLKDILLIVLVGAIRDCRGWDEMRDSNEDGPPELRYEMKKPWRDGTHALVFEPLDLTSTGPAFVLGLF